MTLSEFADRIGWSTDAAKNLAFALHGVGAAELRASGRSIFGIELDRKRLVQVLEQLRYLAGPVLAASSALPPCECFVEVDGSHGEDCPRYGVNDAVYCDALSAERTVAGAARRLGIARSKLRRWVARTGWRP